MRKYQPPKDHFFRLPNSVFALPLDAVQFKLYAYQSGRTIDAARFIMITAAFEWEYKRNFPDGVPKKEARLKAEAAVTDEIDEKIKSSAGKKREIYKFLKRLVKSDSLESEIIHTGKVIDNIIGVFGKHLYHLNGEELKYSEIPAKPCFGEQPAAADGAMQPVKAENDRKTPIFMR